MLLAGWGEEHYGQATQVEQLQWAPTVVQRPRSGANAKLPSSARRARSARSTQPSHRTGGCKGDSGGPLLVPEPSAVGGMVEIGVTSHGYNDCATTSPRVLTRADAISAWVRGWAQALASAPPASASLPAGLVAAPTLAGLASSRSVSLARIMRSRSCSPATAKEEYARGNAEAIVSGAR